MPDRRRKKKERIEEPCLVKQDFDVAGTRYHQEDLHKLVIKNDRKPAAEGYDRIYLYKFIHSPVELIPDPKNEHDKNAIKVIIHNQWIGFIHAEECKEVKELLKKREIKYISGWITGGPSVLYLNGEEISREERNIYASVRIAYYVE